MLCLTSDMDQDKARDYVRNILEEHDEDPNLVLSHADLDHYGWIPHVLGDIQIQNIWQGGEPVGYSEDGFPTWIAAQTADGATVHNNFPASWHNNGNAVGADLDCGDAEVFVLTVNTGSSKNSKSLVLSIEHGDFVATFTGDAEGSTERVARQNFDNAVKTTVLSGSHHGARTRSSNSASWATRTAPEVTVFSAGRRFGHPQCDAVERYRNSLGSATQHPAQCGESSVYQPVFLTDSAQYMTEINGRVIVTSSGNSPLSLFCTGSTGCEAQITH